MNSIREFLARIPRNRRSAMIFYALFSLLWLAGIMAYFYGYKTTIESKGGAMSIAQISFFVTIGLAPIFVIWFPYWLTGLFENERENTAPILTRSNDVLGQLQAISTQNEEAKRALGEIMNSVSTLAYRQNPTSHADIQKQVAHHLDAPNLPLKENASDHAKLLLADLAVALDFTDQVKKGDWALAFDKVMAKGGFVELLKSAEAVIDVLEEDGIFVENLAIDLPPEHAWRALALGERNSETEKLAAIHDRSTSSVLQDRLKNDANFQALSLRFQKRFIEMLAAMAMPASGDELDALANSRSGRAFALLGHLSQTFAAKD